MDIEVKLSCKEKKERKKEKKRKRKQRCKTRKIVQERGLTDEALRNKIVSLRRRFDFEALTTL